MTTIEQTGDRDAMSVAVATLSGVSDILGGDAAAKALATESEMVAFNGWQAQTSS